MAIFICHKVWQLKPKLKEPELILSNFKALLEQGRQNISEEFGEMVQEEEVVMVACPTLEVGSILTMIYAAC